MENLRGVKIVNQDSLMVENSHLYIKAKDENYCELTILDENGKKRKVGATHTNSENEIKITVGTSFASVGQYQRQFNQAVEDWKGSIQTQIDNLLNNKQNNLGYTPENITNKSDSYTASSSTTYSSTKALVDGLATKLDKGAYTGTAQDLKNSIDGKLNKPTTTSTTTSYPFVVGEDGNGNSARLPAGDLGKNFFNSDLSNTTARNHTMNAGVTVNTLGNPYSITGLPNKESDTTNFDKVLKYNPSTGQFAYGQAFVYNVPSTITVNHVNAPASPSVPSYIQAIQDRLTQLNQHGVVMQRFTNWTVKTLNNTVTTTNVENNTNIYTATSVFNTDSSIITNTEVVSVHTNKILPKNADWAILFNIKIGSDGSGNNTAPKTNRLMGIHNSEIGTLIIPSLYLFDSFYGYSTHNLAILKNGGSKLITSAGGTNTADIIFSAAVNSIIPAMILKVGDNILIQAQCGSTTISEIYSAQSLSGDNFGFCVTARKSSVGLEAIGNISNIRYYVFP